jgi:UDP-N-acetylglucosamine 1-carboxyvinyltransferase
MKIEALIKRTKNFHLKIYPCKKIKGKTVEISGSKNASLPLIASTLLFSNEIRLRNFPFLLDTFYALEIARSLGKRITIDREKKEVRISGKIHNWIIPSTYASLFRGSILFLGGVLSAKGKVIAVQPGGCPIGKRPIDIHLDFLKALGGKIEIRENFIKVSLPDKTALKNYRFKLITVTGTENALLLLSRYKGEFLLENIALEPEIFDLLNFLQKYGYDYILYPNRKLLFISRGRGKNVFTVVEHNIIPDRIEAGTFLVLGNLLGNPLIIKNLNVEHLTKVISLLKQSGAKIKIRNKNTVEIYSTKNIRPLNIKTEPYPGFPTDLQAQFMTMLTIANGVSRIEETLFENRFQHAYELKKMGANITIKGRVAIIKGVKYLRGARVKTTDLRAGAGLVLAGLIARKRPTLLMEIYHLLRGYEDLDKKLKKLGCTVEIWDKEKITEENL